MLFNPVWQCLVRRVGFECLGVRSQTCVRTFKQHSAALFGPFLCSGSLSLTLFCPACFKQNFLLLGWVWDWILYIKRCSVRGNRKDRLNRHRGGAGNAPHKQRISPGEAHPFSKDGKCICSRNNSLIIGFLSYNQQMTRKTTSNIVRNSHSSVNSPFFPVAIFLVLWYCSVAERRRRYAERKQLYRRPVVRPLVL